MRQFATAFDGVGYEVNDHCQLIEDEFAIFNTNGCSALWDTMKEAREEAFYRSARRMFVAYGIYSPEPGGFQWFNPDPLTWNTYP